MPMDGVKSRAWYQKSFFHVAYEKQGEVVYHVYVYTRPMLCMDMSKKQEYVCRAKLIGCYVCIRQSYPSRHEENRQNLFHVQDIWRPRGIDEERQVGADESPDAIRAMLYVDSRKIKAKRIYMYT